MKLAAILPKEKIHIPLLTLNFGWYKEQIDIVEVMHYQGYSVQQIANEIGRDRREVLVLLIDVVDKQELDMICELI